MTSEEAKALLEKYNQGLATKDETALLQYWYIHEASKADLPLTEQQYQELAPVMRDEVLQATMPAVRAKLWPRFAIAVAAVAAITLGVWLYYVPSSRQSAATRDLYANDVAPGKNIATLTLADGKVIDLDSSRASVVVTDSVKAMTMLTAATPRGGTYQVILPDGTKVWLNADSKISFPSQFTGKERKIMLSGEAYFEVSTSYTSLRGRRTKQSFVVESSGQQVEVLGTHFNINSYADESSIKTTLLEGSVAVRHAESSSASQNSKAGVLKQVQDDDRFNVVLKPGEQSTLYEGAIKVQPANVEETISWKNGDFVFNGEPLRDIMRKLSRWYNVEIVYEGYVANEQYTAKISRNKNISEVIQLLEQAEGVHFKIEGRRVIVTP